MLSAKIESLKRRGKLPPHVRAGVEKEKRRRMREELEAHLPILELCASNFLYFVTEFCFIYDATEKKWIPFDLWDEQLRVAEDLTAFRLVTILKARQLGMTWLVLAYALWLMIFHPIATVLLFSLRDTEAVYLLSDQRLKGMYKKLPYWFLLRKMNDDGSLSWIPRGREVKSDAHEWILANDSNAKAFPTSAGDSYTASLAIIDEADLVPDLAAMLLKIKPTIDGGGKLFLVSKVDKSQPLSYFKQIYRAAKASDSDFIEWHSIFLPWHARPERTKEWYDLQCKQALKIDKVLDAVYENYPATDLEALAPKSLDKRIHFDFIKAVYFEKPTIEDSQAPYLPSLKIFTKPSPTRYYVAGADPAEGNPASDPSSCIIVDEISGAEVAKISGRFEIASFVGYVEQLCAYYNNAAVLVERNNHGHAVIGLLEEHKLILPISGSDKRYGWLDNHRGKVILYDNCARIIQSEDCLICDVETQSQLAAIEGSTLCAPKGMHDDEADAFALAQMARVLVPRFQMQGGVAGERNMGF